MNPITGGCLCGAIRYQVHSPALQTTLCHCEDCRKASGAPFVAWTFFRTGHLQWLSGRPATVLFANRQRSFCNQCGSPLMFFDPSLPDYYEMNTSTLDDPSPHIPADQCWTSDAIPWTSHIPNLPAYPHTAPLPPLE